MTDKMREVGKDMTFCSYTLPCFETLIRELEEEAVARGESNPELAVLSGSEEDSADKYVQTVITASETFSSDVPVSWRINGVAQLIETSEQDLTAEVSPAQSRE